MNTSFFPLDAGGTVKDGTTTTTSRLLPLHFYFGGKEEVAQF